MAARTRVLAIVAAAAALVVAAVVGVAWLQARGESTTPKGAVTKPRAGIPPLALDFGTDDSAQAKALAQAAALLATGKRTRAAAIFARYHSLQAQIGSAFAAWPDGSLATLQRLAKANPDDAVVQLHLGIAQLWSGRNADAAKQLELVASRFPDTGSAIEAEDVLYAPKDIPGLPYLVLDVPVPGAPTLARQVAVAARDARRPSARAKLAYGALLWHLERRVSAAEQFEAAARLAPDDPVALTAEAVSQFTPRSPTAAFARLGPLSGRFPRAAVVRLHLGLLLIWTGQVRKGEQQLRLATAEQPGSAYSQAARTLLSKLAPNGTK
jgi:tetratricopeptide (TPR) repeat protein